ncbi:MAG TPA: hypothetical protein VHY37_03405 [Tepidisphaeraceae bacterium]|nr:hypothetical protein [Tepidisphaeraceae bacterium]
MSPGTAIALKGDPAVFNSTGQQVKSIVQRCLEAAGHKLGGDFSPYVLDWTSAPGPTENRKFYHTVFPGSRLTNGPAIDVSCPSTVVTVTLTDKNQEIWSTKLTFQAAPYMQLPPEITAQDAANAAAKPQVDRLGNLQIPSFLLKAAAAGASVSPMVSTITPTGIKEGDLVPAPRGRR